MTGKQDQKCRSSSESALYCCLTSACNPAGTDSETTEMAIIRSEETAEVERRETYVPDRGRRRVDWHEVVMMMMRTTMTMIIMMMTIMTTAMMVVLIM